MEQGLLPAAAAAAGTGKERRPLPARAQFLIVGLAFATPVVIGLSSLLPDEDALGWATFLLLLLLVVATDRIELYAGRSHDLRVATMPMVAAALLLPPHYVMLCGFAFCMHSWGAPLMWRQRIFNGCNHALSGLAAWGIVHALPFPHGDGGFGLAVAGTAATTVYAVSTWGLLVSILHLTRDLSLGEMRQELPAVLSAEGGLGALGIVVAGLWRSDPVLVPVAILPLLLIWTSLKVTELRQEASVDAKTGLFNARRLRDSLAAELERAARYQRPLSVLVLDLDFLREVNNTHGHLAGDCVIAGIGDRLRATLRSTDIAARFGGEEFVVVLPETPPARALQLAERVRRAVAEAPFDCGRGIGPVGVTVSVGVAAFPTDALTDVELLQAADAAVYDAKAHGRNRVSVAAARAVAV